MTAAVVIGLTVVALVVLGWLAFRDDGRDAPELRRRTAEDRLADAARRAERRRRLGLDNRDDEGSDE